MLKLKKLKEILTKDIKTESVKELKEKLINDLKIELKDDMKNIFLKKSFIQINY